MPHTEFPNPGLQVLSAFIHFIGVTILTFFFSRRLFAEELTTRRGWASLTWPRLCILLVLIGSYLFMFATGLLIFGVGLESNTTTCTAAIALCIALYTGSKVLIYSFLTEKVYIVWANDTRRLKNPVYLVCMGTILIYVVVVVVLFMERIATFRPGDDACVIGLKPTASIPLLSYDLYINVLLTCLFLWPLLRIKFASPALKQVATRTLVASAVALTTSTVNITVLTILKGRELGWLCLGTCGVDVLFNAAALFWVTSGREARNGSASPTDNQVTLDSVSDMMGSKIEQPAARQRRRPFDNKSSQLWRAESSASLTEFHTHVKTTVDIPLGQTTATEESEQPDLPRAEPCASDTRSLKMIDAHPEPSL
ncbi:hypothetical protein MVEN_00587700 [Mycena venus]|uniref:Uncharacterized protein n=1 Tax=Mycena venus TaxID=2733690 RepID=A0A8H6YR37_9AGAR|nr:hypothetical protein MVEN_00587700 [Mycena venus]